MPRKNKEMRTMESDRKITELSITIMKLVNDVGLTDKEYSYLLSNLLNRQIIRDWKESV